MKNSMTRPEMLAEWIALGWAVADMGDGAWGWTKHGVSSLSEVTRATLSNLAYGRELMRFEQKRLEDEGFTVDGRWKHGIPDRRTR